MKLTISGRDMTVRNDLRSITEKRIAKLTKFFDDNAEVNVIYSKKRNLQIADSVLRYLVIRYEGALPAKREPQKVFAPREAVDAAPAVVETETVVATEVVDEEAPVSEAE